MAVSRAKSISNKLGTIWFIGIVICGPWHLLWLARHADTWRGKAILFFKFCLPALASWPVYVLRLIAHIVTKRETSYGS